VQRKGEGRAWGALDQGMPRVMMAGPGRGRALSNAL